MDNRAHRIQKKTTQVHRGRGNCSSVRAGERPGKSIMALVVCEEKHLGKEHGIRLDREEDLG